MFNCCWLIMMKTQTFQFCDIKNHRSWMLKDIGECFLCYTAVGTVLFDLFDCEQTGVDMKSSQNALEIASIQKTKLIPKNCLQVGLSWAEMP